MNDLLTHIEVNLSAHIDKSIVQDILSSYTKILANHRSGKLDEALLAAGRFVEHVYRAIEFIRTNKVFTEIKSVAATTKALENDTSLPESLRLLIPRALYGMIYNIRSKRNAIHVKEIDPRDIDLAMSVSAASWVLAEFIRLYHISDESDVERCMLALSRTSIPFIEAIGGETVVGRKVTPKIEVLLLLAHANISGLTRNEIGKMAKCSPSSVTTALQWLCKENQVHQSQSKSYFIMSEGENALSEYIVKEN